MTVNTMDVGMEYQEQNNDKTLIYRAYEWFISQRTLPRQEKKYNAILERVRATNAAVDEQ